MPTNILMPALSPTMEKGNLAKWLKKEGDKVKSGDVIAEIETDKATMEVEAVDEGTLAKIVVPEGTEDVAVNSVIAVLAGEGEDVKSAGASAGAKPAATPAPPKPRGSTGCAKPASPPIRPPNRRLRQRESTPVAAPAPAAARQHAKRPTAMPACFRRRSRAGWPRKPASRSAASCRASGPHGRVIARDMARRRNPARA